MKTKNKIWVSLLLAIVLSIVIAFVLPTPDDDKNSDEAFWITKTHSKTKYDIVVCGDSRIYRGISPDDLVSATNTTLKAINLGYSSGGYSSSYLDFAVSKLNPLSKNKILVLGITPHSLTKEAFANKHLQSFQKLSTLSIYKGKYFSSLTKYLNPRKLVSLVDDESGKLHTKNYASGWMASWYNNTDSLEAIASYKKTFSKYQVEQEEVDSLLSNIEKLQDKGITIIAFRPPTTTVMDSLENAISGFNEAYLSNKLDSLGILYITFNSAKYLSYDGSHLHKKSAIKLSKDIGVIINNKNLIK